MTASTACQLDPCTDVFSCAQETVVHPGAPLWTSPAPHATAVINKDESLQPVDFLSSDLIDLEIINGAGNEPMNAIEIPFANKSLGGV